MDVNHSDLSDPLGFFILGLISRRDGESMTGASMHKGSCLCGTVKYEVRGQLGAAIYCHCSLCRKFTAEFVKSKSAEIVRGSRDIDGLWICAIDAQSHVDLAHPAAESVRARSA